MSSLAAAPVFAELSDAVACEARKGLTAHPRTLSPWLFYDVRGSQLFEAITELPEYYLTRTERAIFTACADQILALSAARRRLTLVELGAGSATKTGILLEAAVRRQGSVVYQPVDVSQTALDMACDKIGSQIAGVTVRPQLANYVLEPLALNRRPETRVLALYIGSSIGNFSPQEARAILSKLRQQLAPGDYLLLGTDLAPGRNKSEATLIAAYDDAAGVTAAFNKNVLVRLNRELGTDFDLDRFRHIARWNPAESRIEMHLESTEYQQVVLPADAGGEALTLTFTPGQTIHTENSYKFTAPAIDALLSASGFRSTHAFTDPDALFAVTLATAV